MGSSKQSELSDSDSSDEDLPVFDFSQPRCSQAPTHDLVVLDRSDPEIPPLSSSPRSRKAPVTMGAARGDVFMVSSESEEEEVFIPLAMRLKQRQEAQVAPSTTATDADEGQSSAVNRPGVFAHHHPVSTPFTSILAQHVTPVEYVEEYTDARGYPNAPDGFCPSTKPPSGGAGTTHPAKRKRSTAEMEAAKEEALRRRVERERQQGEKERQRADKRALVDAVKALRPEECIRHLVVSVDPALLQLEGGGTLLTSLQALGCSCAIEKQTLPRSVTWARRAPSHQTGEVVSIPESHTVIHVPVDDFISMIHSYNQEQRGGFSDSSVSLTSWTQRLLSRKPGRTLSLVVIDIEKYFKSQKSKSQKKFREAVLGEEQGAGSTGAGIRRKRKEASQPLPEVSRVEVEEALVHLQLHTDVQVRFLPTWKDFSDYVTMSTKSVAEAPFKRERENTGFDFYLESEWAGGQRVDRAGKGLLQVWQRQIQQLNRVSPDMASAILSTYPSPRLLTQAYKRCQSERDKVALLSDVLIRRGEGVTSTTRRVGPELSKRLFLLMTSVDPQQILDCTV